MAGEDGYSAFPYGLKFRHGEGGLEGFDEFVFATALQRAAGTEWERDEFFKKSLEFLRETDIEGNRFFARRGKAPRLPAGQ